LIEKQLIIKQVLFRENLMTSFKDIKFGRSDFTIRPGDTVTIKAEGLIDRFSFEVKHVHGFTLIPVKPVILSDGHTLKEVVVVDHGIEVTHVNGIVFNSFNQSRNNNKALPSELYNNEDSDEIRQC